jgi:hypothetical protein
MASAWGQAAAMGGVAAGAGAPTHAIRITELRVDQQGADTDEYFELTGRPTASLADLWLLAIGDGGSDPGGVVEAAIDLSKWSLGANGRFVGHEATFGKTAFGGTTLAIDPAASHAAVGTGDAINFENADSVTYLLVRAFRGGVGLDLDAANDGELDAAPWTELLDAVAFVRSGPPEPVYAAVRVGPVALTATGGMPPHAWLAEDGWRVGEYASWSADTPGGGAAVPAPGAALTLAAAGMAAAGARRRRAQRATGAAGAGAGACDPRATCSSSIGSRSSRVRIA